MSRFSITKIAKWLSFIVLFWIGITGSLIASDTNAFPWIIDEQQLLSEQTTKSLSLILSQSAQTRNISVRVMILNERNSAMSFEELAKQKVAEWEALNLQANLLNTTYLVINLATSESAIILGKDTPATTALLNNLQTIQTSIIMRALAQHQPKRAIVDGAIGLVTVLDEWSDADYAFQQWWDTFKESAIFLSLKWLAQLSVLGAIIYTLRRLFHRPDGETLAAQINEESLFYHYPF